MSIHASGAAAVRAFDPERDTHYALDEWAHLELRTLFAAIDVLSQLTDTPPREDGPEVDLRRLSPIFASLASHGERIMAEMTERCPSHRRAAA